MRTDTDSGHQRGDFIILIYGVAFQVCKAAMDSSSRVLSFMRKYFSIAFHFLTNKVFMSKGYLKIMTTSL